jgi:hypothetical protein
MQITDIVVRQAKPSDPCKPSCPRRKRQANAPLMRVSAIGSTETWPALTAWRTSTQKKRDYNDTCRTQGPCAPAFGSTASAATAAAAKQRTVKWISQ